MLSGYLAAIEGGDIEIGGTTVLMQMARYGWHEAIILSLKGVDKPQDIDAEDENGYTALCWAISSGHQAIAQLLIDRGANVTRALKNFPDHKGLQVPDKPIRKRKRGA